MGHDLSLIDGAVKCVRASASAQLTNVSRTYRFHTLLEDYFRCYSTL